MPQLKKTLIIKDPEMRAKEEFAEYWPKALEHSASRLSQMTRGQVRMQDMVDVFRTVYCMAFVHGAYLQMLEINTIEEFKRAESSGA